MNTEVTDRDEMLNRSFPLAKRRKTGCPSIGSARGV